MSEWPMTEEQKADMKAYLAECRRESDLARKRYDKALAEYLEKFKQPVYRKGTLSNEEGGTQPAIFEVIRYPQVVDNDYYINRGWIDSSGKRVEGHRVTLWVSETVYIFNGNEGWGSEARIYYLYFDANGDFHHEVMLDIDEIMLRYNHRHDKEEPVYGRSTNLLKGMNVLLDDPEYIGVPDPSQLDLTTPAA